MEDEDKEALTALLVQLIQEARETGAKEALSAPVDPSRIDVTVPAPIVEVENHFDVEKIVEAFGKFTGSDMATAVEAIAQAVEAVSTRDIPTEGLSKAVDGLGDKLDSRFEQQTRAFINANQTLQKDFQATLQNLWNAVDSRMSELESRQNVLIELATSDRVILHDDATGEPVGIRVIRPTSQ